MLLKFSLIIILVLHVSAVEKPFDCGDAEDRLRCKRKCPEHRIIRDRSCPFKRVCCLGRPSSIYSPLRELPFYKPSPEVAKAIQNNGYNYVINRYNTSYPIRIVLAEDGNKPEIIPTARTTPMSPTNIVESKLQKSRDRKSVKYCNKYAELTVDYLHAMPLQSVFLPFTLPMDDCLPRFTPLIVGGKNVSRGEYPHMAAVGYDKTDYIDYLCGGSLISEKFVLTAAHCIGTKWGKPVVVMLGSTELYSEEAIEVGVKRTFPYPGYELPSYDDDIALIELDREVKFSKYVRPACLPLPRTNTTKPGSVTIATGWGKTDFARAASLYLMKVLLEIRESVECEDWYKSEKRQGLLNHGINEKLICANGHESEYHDTCQGDSGGPLQQILPGHNCMYQIVAVTSFGKTCGTSIPGVYTKVEPYLDWIEGIVWPDDDT